MSQKDAFYNQKRQLFIDGGLFAASLTASYLIRFEGPPPWVWTRQFLVWLPYVVAARLIVNWRLGIYRFIWRYVSLHDALVIVKSLSIVTGILLFLRFAFPSSMFPSLRVHIPLGVIALEYLLSLVGMVGVRAWRRMHYEQGTKQSRGSQEECKRVLLYGAGRAGVLLLKDLLNNCGLEVVGFLDDDPNKNGAVIMGKKVLGRGEDLGQLARSLEVDEVFISIASADHRTVTGIFKKCEAASVPAKIIPPLQEILEGRVRISQVREVQMEDLLGREDIEVSDLDEQVRHVYTGKRILVTGAGGSIGSELVRQLLALDPEAVALLDKDENSVYELEQELAFTYPSAQVEPMIADIRNGERLRALLNEFKPQIVFHAAAHKHVPLMEKHPCEAVLNNVLGTQTLLEACRDGCVDRFVFISTDKAVNPVNIMGATKRVGELLVRAAASDGAMASACVRFGNVLGSRGSVIPLFQKQIAEGGPITVTHPDVVRFFMTIPEAVQLVLCAGTLGTRGEVFVLDMGNPRRILDLAHEMAELHGLTPGKDIEIRITGLRPGEKLYEELVESNETAHPTRFEKLTMVVPPPVEVEGTLENVEKLILAAQCNDAAAVHYCMSRMGFGFKPHLKHPAGVPVTEDKRFGLSRRGLHLAESKPDGDLDIQPLSVAARSSWPQRDERRQMVRRIITLRGVISFADGRSTTIRTENLSESGVCFVAEQTLKVGEQFRIGLGYSPDSEEADIPARVVWTRPLKDSGRSLFGVQFEEMIGQLDALQLRTDTYLPG